MVYVWSRCFVSAAPVDKQRRCAPERLARREASDEHLTAVLTDVVVFFLKSANTPSVEIAVKQQHLTAVFDRRAGVLRGEAHEHPQSKAAAPVV